MWDFDIILDQSDHGLRVQMTVSFHCTGKEKTLPSGTILLRIVRANQTRLCTVVHLMIGKSDQGIAGTWPPEPVECCPAIEINGIKRQYQILLLMSYPRESFFFMVCQMPFTGCRACFGRDSYVRRPPGEVQQYDMHLINGATQIFLS
ncbi:MAG: hypothetical protein CVU06_07955 [Bacteroidetes bacterium HGW-Bacteroidetes-22]|nr:MAG: hypothetical protein CVU06_07955 [Bacteroidetes bacterium HGW-Bacteroidetes-22]